MTKFEKIIYGSPPSVFLIRISKIISLPGFKGLSLFEVGVAFLNHVKHVGLSQRASAISFNLIMAFPAAILFLFSIVPYLPGSEVLDTQIMTLFKDIAPNSSTYFFIKNILKDLLVKHVGVFSFGFVLVMFYASNAMMGIIRMFDKSIQQNKAYFFHRRLRAVILTTILIFLVIASATLLIGQDQFSTVLKHFFHMKKKAKLQWWNSARWIILVFFLFYGIAFIYKFGPSVKKRWPIITPGSFIATLLTLIVTLFFGYWVNNFSSYNKVYGSIGTVLIIMLLINLNSIILLIGFELNVSILKLLSDRGEESPSF